MPRPVIRSLRRDQIVRAALRLTRRAGVLGFTTADVAAEAGVSRGILHYHFASKDEIIREALRLLLVEFGRRAAEAARAAGSGTAARLHAAVDTAFSDEGLGFYTALLEFWPYAARQEVHRSAMARLYDTWVAFLAGVIREGVLRGEVAARGGQPEDLACALVAVQDGLMVQRLVRREWMPAERARAIAHATVDRLLAPATPTPL